MGSILAHIMQKSHAYKYESSLRDAAESDDKSDIRNLSAADAGSSVDDELLSNSLSISQSETISTKHEQLSSPDGRPESSSSSVSSSAMDCITSNKPSEEAEGTSSQALSHQPPGHIGRLFEENRPSTSQVGGARERRSAYHPIKARNEAATAELHKCVSEPFTQPVSTHRTSSEIPATMLKNGRRNDAPTLSLPNERSTNYGLDVDSFVKHMEGNSMTQESPNECAVQKSTPLPIEIGDYHRPALSPKSLQAEIYDRLDDRSRTSLSDSDKEGEATTSTTISVTSSSKESSVTKVIRNMEYVCTIIKKKMYPTVFEANKYIFMEKVLSNSQVQYGYQNERYIKIGSGEFGEVLYGRMKDGGHLVAIKALKKDNTDMFALLQEAFFLQLASNTGFAATYRGIAPFCALGSKFLYWAIICDFIGSAEGPFPYDFRQTLKKARNSHRTLQLVLDWIFTCTKIAFAVKQFHNMGMLLNDIKADNILLRPSSTGSFDPVFVDFGLASVGEGITLALEVNDSNRAKILKEYSHIAPEVLFGGETNIQSDVFSLGKALSLISDAFPVEAFVNVIARCTLWKVNERPSIDELINNFQWLSRNILLNK